MATLKDELSKLFERLEDFTRLGATNDLGDLARVPKLQLAKQISENFVSKDRLKEADLKDWLRKHIEAKVTAKEEATKIKDWDGFVDFKRRYQNLLKNFIREVGILGRSQKWLDSTQLIDSLNKVNLEESWGRGKIASATLAALRSVL